MQIFENIIYLIGRKNTFYELNLKTSKITNSLKFESTQITAFIVLNKKIYIATIKSQIEIYNLEKAFIVQEEDAPPLNI